MEEEIEIEMEGDDMQSLRQWATKDEENEKDDDKLYMAAIGGVIFLVLAYYLWKKSKKMALLKENESKIKKIV